MSYKIKRRATEELPDILFYSNIKAVISLLLF